MDKAVVVYGIVVPDSKIGDDPAFVDTGCRLAVAVIAEKENERTNALDIVASNAVRPRATAMRKFLVIIVVVIVRPVLLIDFV